ncbi:MAG: CpsD/CapB family tyrosine-protein kinase [Solobacterium sp.]|nr:CpsD/CapB family tyrosine-protein kinase [Solobacterium sp.]
MNSISITNMPELSFDVQEAINQLRINLGFTGESIKVIMVTSSMPNEGKSFVAMNLWKNMANVGNRVVLIDADLRNSEIRNRYGFVCESGLMGIEHFLSGKTEINDSFYMTDIRNGFIVPVSTNVIDPTTLLESIRLKQLVEACRKEFDYVIIDTPPLGSVADALNIAKLCDGSLLVVASNSTPRKAVNDVVSSLKRTEKPLLGIVLNRVDTSIKNSSYGYYYRYGGYGQYGQYGKKDK